MRQAHLVLVLICIARSLLRVRKGRHGRQGSSEELGFANPARPWTQQHTTAGPAAIALACNRAHGRRPCLPPNQRAQSPVAPHIRPLLIQPHSVVWAAPLHGVCALPPGCHRGEMRLPETPTLRLAAPRLPLAARLRLDLSRWMFKKLLLLFPAALQTIATMNAVQLRQPAFVASTTAGRAQTRARGLVACRAQQQGPVQELGRKAAAVRPAATLDCSTAKSSRRHATLL